MPRGDQTQKEGETSAISKTCVAEDIQKEPEQCVDMDTNKGQSKGIRSLENTMCQAGLEREYRAIEARFEDFRDTIDRLNALVPDEEAVETLRDENRKLKVQLAIARQREVVQREFWDLKETTLKNEEEERLKAVKVKLQKLEIENTALASNGQQQLTHIDNLRTALSRSRDAATEDRLDAADRENRLEELSNKAQSLIEDNMQFYRYARKLEEKNERLQQDLDKAKGKVLKLTNQLEDLKRNVRKLTTAMNGIIDGNSLPEYCTK